MGIFSTVRGLVSGNYQRKAEEDFQIQTLVSSQMSAWVNECAEIYKGNPCWLDTEDHIDTVNFAKAICSELARLATMGISVTLSGSARAEWIQKQMDTIKPRLRHWVEYACAYGTVILKPNGESIDLYFPGGFDVTAEHNGKITGAVFYNSTPDAKGDRWYTRMEYHRFLPDGRYVISNRCYVGYSKGDLSRPVHISLTPWKDLLEEAVIVNITEPLFSVLRTPQANNIDVNSPMGLPVFSEAVQELRDLDIAYSRNSKEVRDSRRTVLLDADKLLPGGGPTEITPWFLNHQREELGLPDMVKAVNGDHSENYYQEINPTLNTETRVVGINALLSQIGFKSGFSNGHFVFNESTGIQTATQVEADQQRTIQLVADVRDQLAECIRGLVYALNAMADLYKLAPAGRYSLEDALHFDDIVYSFEEDKMHHYQLALQGHYPWEMYFMKYLKCSQEEAKAILEMAKKENKAPTLFGYGDE